MQQLRMMQQKHFRKRNCNRAFLSVYSSALYFVNIRRRVSVSSQRADIDLDFVDNEFNGRVLTIVYKEQLANVRRLTKYCVRPAAEINAAKTSNVQQITGIMQQ